MRWQAGSALRRELGPGATAVVLDSADERYVAPPPLAQTPPGHLNLQMAAYLLALRDALLMLGYPPAAANDLLARGLYRVMTRFYRPMDALAVAVHPRNRLARARWRQRLSRRFIFTPPDWLMDEAPDAGAYGFDVRRCLLAEYMERRGEQRFCQDVLCRQDMLMAEGRGERLSRTRTIAAGDDRCDFRYSTSRDRAGAT